MKEAFFQKSAENVGDGFQEKCFLSTLDQQLYDIFYSTEMCGKTIV